MMQTSIASLLVGILGMCSALEGIRVEPQAEAKPYAFTYTAGRASGHTDRIHSEVRDGSGIVQGLFSYIDPRQQVRTVEYVADQFGFHLLHMSHVPRPNQDTAAVAKEKLNHAALYNRIALEQQRIALERGELGEDDGSYRPQPNEDVQPHVGPIVLPRDTKTVGNAKAKHLALYDKIAREHAEIADHKQ